MSENRPATQALSGLSPLQKAALAIKELRTRLADTEYAQREPIAIIGMGCRFPQADGLEDYWRLLSKGIDAIREVPADRWDLSQLFDTNPNAPGKINTRYGGFLDNVAGFDAEFFGISPYEAERIDPQQRILLEVAWHALEDAGLPPAQLRGTRTGVFVGITQMDYGVMQLGGELNDIDAYTGTGNGFCFAAGRLSYLLGLQGPAFSVDTACSSSMVALHQACQALRNGECDLALVAGAQLNLTPSMQVFLSKTQSFAPDGRCRTFDESADGFVLGEGVGVIVLRRLSDAQQCNDQMRAVVRGSGVNHDGPASGLTVPNENAQLALIREVYQRAGISPNDIDYVEAHGTATQLGDPIEVAALRSVFGQRASGDDLWLGSVKTNFGHLSAAAGIAGLIKVVLMLEHEKIAPNLHFKQPSASIVWDDFSVRVPTQLESWTRQQKLRRAAVSSFGLSGTNTHIVLEDVPFPQPTAQSAIPAAKRAEAGAAQRPLHLLCLSARNQPSLLQSAQNMLDCVAMSDDTSLADICFSANSGRNHFGCRLTLVAHNKSVLCQQLQAFIANKQMPGIATGVAAKGGSGRLAMFFSDDVPVAEIHQLAQTQPDVAASLRRCQTLADKVEPGLLVEGQDSNAALFSAQFAIAELWLSWGMKPAAVAGSGVGELTALCVAGVLDLDQAFQVLAGHAVDARMASLAVYSGVDGRLLPYGALTGYRLPLLASSLAPSMKQSSCSNATQGLVKAGFKTLLGVGRQDVAINSVEVIGLTHQETSLWSAILATLTQLYLQGFSVDWTAYDGVYSRQRVRLPGYAFQRQRYWRGSAQQAVASEVPASESLATSNPQTTKVAAPTADIETRSKVSALVGTGLVTPNPQTTKVAEPTADIETRSKVSTLVASTPVASSPVAQNVPQLLAAQLALASDAINDVVEQQLAFLKQRTKSRPGQRALVAQAATTQTTTTAVIQVEKKSLARFQLGDWYLLLMAAEHEQAVKQLVDKLANNITDQTTQVIGLDAVIGSGKTRSILVHQGNDDAALALGKQDNQGKAGKPDLKRVIFATAQPKRDLVFMFPGVGDHYLNMAQGLYCHEAVFRDTVDRCCDYLKSSLGIDLIEVLYPAPSPQLEPLLDQVKDAALATPSTLEKMSEKKPENKTENKMDFRAMLGRGSAAVDPSTEKLNRTQHSQPLVFIIEYALGQLWLSRGVKPQAMIGYSIGEYAVACLAGVIELEDVLRLITVRAQMIQTIPAGVMLAVPLSEHKLLPLLNAQLSLAIVSTPGLCVVGGTEQAISLLEAHLHQDEVVSRRLPGTHAFHSHMLAPLHESLVELVQGFSLQAPKIPYISNLTGNWISDHEATDPAYWARHTWQTVRFSDGLAKLLDTEGRVFLEVGPGQSLGSFVLQHPAAQQLQDKIVLPSLKNRYEKQPDEAFLLGTLGKLWLSGFNFN